MSNYPEGCRGVADERDNSWDCSECDAVRRSECPLISRENRELNTNDMFGGCVAPLGFSEKNSGLTPELNSTQQGHQLPLLEPQKGSSEGPATPSSSDPIQYQQTRFSPDFESELGDCRRLLELTKLPPMTDPNKAVKVVLDFHTYEALLRHLRVVETMLSHAEAHQLILVNDAQGNSHSLPYVPSTTDADLETEYQSLLKNKGLWGLELGFKLHAQSYLRKTLRKMSVYQFLAARLKSRS